MENGSVEITLMRGGTSKGVFLRKEEFEKIPEEYRERAILSIFGSPDARQIDGLGGATSTTSKMMIVARSSEPDIDVEYTFGQIAVDKPLIDYGGNCGNLTAAVGVFAVDEGMVAAHEPVTTLTLYNTNTQKRVVAEIPVEGGKAKTEGDCRIQGVPGTSARIVNRYINPSGGVTGKLFPTGNKIDILEVGTEEIRCSILDVMNPVVFLLAKNLSLTGKELPEEVNSDPQLLSKLEMIRGEVAERLGLVRDSTETAATSPGIPKIAFVAPPDDYDDSYGNAIKSEELNLLARMMSMQKAHPTYAVTGAMCTAAAAVLEGTVVSEIARFDTRSSEEEREREVVIGHPRGTISVRVKLAKTATGNTEILEAVVYRTARKLMKGSAFYRI